MVPIYLLSVLLLVSAFGSESDSDGSKTDTSGTTTVNSTSVTYGSLASNPIPVPPEVLDPDLPKTLTQMALSPLLVASRRFNHLPLESLFPRIQATARSAAANPTENATPHLNQTQIDLTSALLNHSLHHGSDDELDRIVFSNLPEGSKLVLKTVKIMKTDEDGNEEPIGQPAISLDVLPIGSDRSDTEEEQEEDEEDEEVKGQRRDLASDASSHKAAGYDSYSANEKVKDKKEDYHQGQDFAQGHKQTLTDSQGKKVSNYKGREKGLTDFDHAHGNLQSSDGERFKNSKKKNKGRKVTGFKRVYHKEEFQRTEHFYDDEEAKKIAESFGLTEAKEKKEHGKKDDDRKYHGGRIEHTDGEKVKNEHSTHKGQHKGQNVAHENSEKHKQAQHQSNHQHTPNYRYYHYNQQNQHQPHPNHRYNAPSYGYAYPNYDPSTASAQETSVGRPAGENVPKFANLPILPKPKPIFYPKVTENTEVDLDLRLKPDEVKVYRTQKSRFIPPPQSYYYAPNFGPPPSTTTDHATVVNYYHQGYDDSGSNGFGSGRKLPVTTPRMKLNADHRYAGIYSTPPPPPRPPTLDTPPFYSSIVNINSPSQVNANPPPIPFYHDGKNLIGIEKAVVTKVPSPGTYFAVPDSRGVFFSRGFNNWNPISSSSALTGQNYNVTSTNVSKIQTFPFPVNYQKQNEPVKLLSPGNENTYVANSTGRVTATVVPNFGYARNPPNFSPRPFVTRTPRLLPVRPAHGQYIRLKAESGGPSSSTPFPIVPNLPISSSFYYGPTLIQNQNQEHFESNSQESNSQSQSPNFPSQNHGRRGPQTFSNFMNTLMNSVSEFFSRMG